MAFSSKNKFFTLEVCSLPKFETLKQQFGRKRWEHKNHLIIYLSYRMYQVCRLLLLSSIIFLNYFRPSSPPFCSICLPIGLKFVVPKFVFLFKANFWVHVLFTKRNYKSYPLSHVLTHMCHLHFLPCSEIIDNIYLQCTVIVQCTMYHILQVIVCRPCTVYIKI